MLLFEKPCCLFFLVVLDGILFILTGNDDIHKSLDEFEIHPDQTTRGSVLGRFGRNTRPRGLNFALYWSQGEVGVSLIFFFFLSAHHRQALMSVCTNNILFLFCLMLIVCVLSYFVNEDLHKMP